MTTIWEVQEALAEWWRGDFTGKVYEIQPGAGEVQVGIGDMTIRVPIFAFDVTVIKSGLVTARICAGYHDLLGLFVSTVDVPASTIRSRNGIQGK